MDTTEWADLLQDPAYEWKALNPGATENELADLSAWAGRPLPPDYLAFLRLTNGAEIWYRELWMLLLLPSIDIPEQALIRHVVPENIPGGMLFGHDTGDELLLFDTRPELPDGQYPVYAIYNLEVGHGWAAAIRVADNFRDLLLLRQDLLHGVEE